MGGNHSKTGSNIKFRHLVAAHQKKTKIVEQDTKFLTSTYSFTSLIQMPEFLEGFSHFTNLR